MVETKRIVYGYSPGDEITLGGETHEVSYVNFTQGYEDYRGDFTIRTECGLSLSGPADKVIPILYE